MKGEKQPNLEPGTTFYNVDNKCDENATIGNITMGDFQGGGTVCKF